MRPYELMYLCPPTLDEERIGAVSERIQQTIGNLGGKIEKIVPTAKRRLVFVEGRFPPRTYTAREGRERMSLDISANDFQMLDPRPDRSGTAPSDSAQPAARVAEGEKFDPDEIPF